MLRVFQNKGSIEIIGFWSMHFGFVLDLSDIDLLNIDLLDQRSTHLDLSVSKTSSRRLQDVSSKRLQDMSSKRLQDMSSRRLQDISCLQDELEHKKLLHWKRVEDVFKTCLEDVLKTNKCLLGCVFIYSNTIHCTASCSNIMCAFVVLYFAIVA